MDNYCFGIDFGTTNSAVAVIAEYDGKMISTAKYIGDSGSKEHPLPSYVAINRTTGEVKTGLEGKRSIKDHANYKVFSSIKTVIDEDLSWEIAGKKWSPVDIATELFKALKENVRNRFADINTAVVAVPAGFTSKKKNNVRRAAKAAGIKVSMFVSEPTAAYCSKLEELKKYKNVAVFDWGGGTLDVVVLRISGNTVTELAKQVWNYAGNDIDKKIAEKICTKVANKNKTNIRFDDLEDHAQQVLLDMCEQAKCDLADDDIADVFSMEEVKGLGYVDEQLDYDYFSLLIENEMDHAVDVLLNTLSEAGLNRESIDCIVFEGGSSRLRPLHFKLFEYFDRDKLFFSRTAMWDIAAGAAQIAFRPGCHFLSRPIGIIQSNNQFYPLLKAGQRIPTEEKHVKFGVIETTDEARFVLSDGEDPDSQTFTDYFPVKLRGFSDEVLQVSCYVDSDTVFRMKIKSNRMPDGVYRVWTYDNLKVAYEINPPSPNTRES